MKMRIALLPVVFAILMAIAGIGIPIPGATYGTPWMTAVHSQTMPDGESYDVDNIIFFLWGQEYTVVGKGLIQSKFTAYDFRDFPFYSMLAMILSVVIGIVTIILNKNSKLVLKGKEFNITGAENPLWLLFISTTLTTVATIYLYYAAGVTIIPMFEANNYVTEYSYGIQFMGISAVAFVISMVMTYLNFLSENKAE